MKLWLDDERPAPEGWEWVQTAATAIAFLDPGTVTHLSLDHDLGSYSGTGYDVLVWLEVQLEAGYVPVPYENITIHSMNPVGRARMNVVLQRLKDEHATRWRSLK